MTQDPISGPVSPALGENASIGVHIADTLRSHPRPGSNSVGAAVVAPAPVSFAENQRGELVEAAVTQSLSKPGGKPGQGYPAIRSEQGVRRLTPTECERLMGWPDGWTLADGPSLVDAPQGWPSDDVSPVDPKPDGRRYSACGDGVVAHVAEWIGLGLLAGLLGGRQEVADGGEENLAGVHGLAISEFGGFGESGREGVQGGGGNGGGVGHETDAAAELGRRKINSAEQGSDAPRRAAA